jgi:hypothetical protein
VARIGVRRRAKVRRVLKGCIVIAGRVKSLNFLGRVVE